MKAGQKKGAGLPFRLATYFRNNPEEWLTYEDICAKFECSRAMAQHAVSALKVDRRIRCDYVIRAAKEAA